MFSIKTKQPFSVDSSEVNAVPTPLHHLYQSLNYSAFEVIMRSLMLPCPAQLDMAFSDTLWDFPPCDCSVRLMYCSRQIISFNLNQH